MSAHNAGPVTLSIANGQTDTPALSSLFSRGQLKALLGSLVQMVIQAPSALTGAVTIQVVGTEGSSSWVTLQSPAGTDIPIAASKAVIVNAGAFRDLRLHSASAEGAQRDFVLTFQLTVT